MKKLPLQLLVIVGLFLGTWFALKQIDWTSLLKVKQVTKSTEEKLGEAIWTMMSETETQLRSKTVDNAVDSLVDHICKANHIDKSTIKVHILKKDEINAFSLPDNYLVIYSGLITASQNEAELMGVLGHEIAHMEKNHVMKKLVKEIGLSALITMTTGNKGGEAVKQIAKTLSSTAYDRDLEREADMTSVDYLIKADIDPEPFANFLFRLGDEEKNIPNQVYWISTHPESKERAEAIVTYIKDKPYKKTTVLSTAEWQKLKEKVKDGD